MPRGSLDTPGEAEPPTEEAMDRAWDSCHCGGDEAAVAAAAAAATAGDDSSPEDWRRGLGLAMAASTCSHSQGPAKSLTYIKYNFTLQSKMHCCTA